MSNARGQCPKCGFPNPYTAALCGQCHARLPWADSVQSDSFDHATQAAKKAVALGATPIYTRRPKPVASAPNTESEPDFYWGFAFFSALMPLVGILAAAIMAFSSPRKAWSCFVGSIAGGIVGFLLLTALLSAS